MPTLSEITSEELDRLEVFRERVLRNVELNRTIRELRKPGGKRKMPKRNRTDLEHEADFWFRVHIRGLKECWNWKSLVHPVNPYGLLNFKGRMIASHRIAFLLFTGHPPTQFVCHKCDNFSCCNPLHLYDGTPKQNTQDAVSRGRMARGSHHGMAKLNESQVAGILNDPDYGSLGWLQKMATRYQVCKATICLIRRRKTWKCVST